jgi:hypothetical protein
MTFYFGGLKFPVHYGLENAIESYHLILYFLVQAAITKCPGLSGLWAGKSRSRCQQIWCLVEEHCLLAHGQHFFLPCSHMVGGVRGISDLFYKGTDTICEGSTFKSKSPPQTSPPRTISLWIRIST